MNSNLPCQFQNLETFISYFDEQSLWSAPFSLLLFKHLELKKGISVAEIGSGHSMIELSERLGNSCKVYGIASITAARELAKQKIEAYGITNLEILPTLDSIIPLQDNLLDLLVYKQAFNSFSEFQSVLPECWRMLQPGGKLVLVTNLYGFWFGFYRIFEGVLHSLGKAELVPILVKEEMQRGAKASISRHLTDCGFAVSRTYEEHFEMRFNDGSAFLNHHFIKMGWLTSWLRRFSGTEYEALYEALENALNSHAAANGGLKLSVPIVYIEGEKI